MITPTQTIFDKFRNGLSTVLEFLVSIAFTVIVILTILLVILRYLFNSSIIFGNELIEYLFIYTTAFGAAVSLGKGDHIQIDYFKNKLPPLPKLIVETLGQLVVGTINVIITILSLKWIESVGSWESPVMRIPMWTIEICIPIGCILVSVFAVLNIYSLISNYYHTRKGRTA